MSHSPHLTSSKARNLRPFFSLVTRFVNTAHCLLLVICALPSTAEAVTYYYTGASETAQAAHLSQARMRMDAHPKCKGNSCHVLAWTVLWDANTTGQYVEAGIGYASRFQCPKKASVGLWWASPQSLYSTKVGCVPRGTEVKVTVYHEDGATGILATWEWDGGEVSQWIDTPDWIVGLGIHLTKIEVCSNKDHLTPSPVSMTVSDVLLYNEDTQVFLQQTPPYLAQPGSLATTFSVNF